MLCSPSKRLYRINQFQVINLLGPYVVKVTIRNSGAVNIPLSSEHLNEKNEKRENKSKGTAKVLTKRDTRAKHLVGDTQLL